MAASGVQTKESMLQTPSSVAFFEFSRLEVAKDCEGIRTCPLERWNKLVRTKFSYGKERLSRTPTKNMRALRKPQRHATMHIPDSPPQETNLSTTPFEITTRSAELANQ
eukprot:1061792-Amorphochlora_amoeboformis.AAC.1